MPRAPDQWGITRRNEKTRLQMPSNAFLTPFIADIATVVSLVGSMFSLYVWRSLALAKRRFTAKGRLPDLQNRLQVTVRKMPEAIGTWADEGIRVKSHASNGLACLRSAKPHILVRAHRRDFTKLVKELEVSLQSHKAWTRDASWACHRVLESALVHIEQAEKDLSWM